MDVCLQRSQDVALVFCARDREKSFRYISQIEIGAANLRCYENSSNRKIVDG
jgi:hypothetical protein